MKLRSAALAAAAITAFAGLAGPAGAATRTDTTRLEAAIKVGDDSTGIRRHLKQFQLIADANDGNRATGTSGHEASADYLESQIPTSYWTTERQDFQAKIFEVTTAPLLSSTPAPAEGWEYGKSYDLMSYSGNGTVSNALTAAVDFVEPTSRASTSSAGCELADFDVTPVSGKVALLQRGTCDFSVKAKNAQDRGAVAAVIFNEGTLGDEERNGLISGTIGAENTYTIPVLEATYAAGRFLVDHPEARVSLSTNNLIETKNTFNVIATSKAGRTDRQILSGAHLDSVPEGAGINDDGTGSATQIELARKLAYLNIKPRNKIKLLWFSGEEQGLFGSTYYADKMTKAERGSTLGMLDFDMLGSRNYALQIYDGDGSAFATAGPNGSGSIERVFKDWFDEAGLYAEQIEFDGRSDYDQFTVVGVPAGGIATGAEVRKSQKQWEQWGGTVDEQFDPCYHLACDSYGIGDHPDNVSNDALGWMSDAAANAVLTFAMTTSSINGTSKGSASSTKDYEWKGDRRVK